MALFGNNLYDLRYTILNEAYIGKTETLLEIEEEFNKLKAKNLKITANMSTDPCVIRINRLFEKQFGMDIFALKVIPSIRANAYTQVIAMNFDIAEEVDLPSMVTGDINRGFRYKDGNDLCIIVNISYGIIMDQRLTGAHIVSCILHEIGHNFADCLYNDINIANKEYMKSLKEYIIKNCFYSSFLKIYTNRYRREQDAKQRKRGSFVNKLTGLVKGIFGVVSDWDTIITNVIYRITGTSTRNVKKYKRMKGTNGKEEARKSLSRQNEVIADKFAGVYGYGLEVAQLLKAISMDNDEVDNIINKLGKNAQKANDAYKQASMDINDFDCHPHLIQRIYDEIKLLERELAKEDIDPIVKEVIVEQLELLKQYVASITEAKEGISNNEAAQRAYNDYVSKKSSDSVDKEIEDKIEESLDRLLEESKKKMNKKKNK